MKITKTQLRQIIKEEVQKELDEGFLSGIKDFITGDQLSATDKDIIARRTQALVDSGAGESEAAEQAKKELKAKSLDRMGKLKAPKDYGDTSMRYDSSSFSDKDRAEIAGMKRQQRDQRNASRPTYASAKSDAEARNLLRARSGR